MNYLDYVIYRVYIYLEKQDKGSAESRTCDFLMLLLASIIIPVAIWLYRLTSGNWESFSIDFRIRWLMAAVLLFILYLLVRGKVKSTVSEENIELLRKKYGKYESMHSVWWIIIVPFLLIFLIPMLEGVVRGTLRFPFLEN